MFKGVPTLHFYEQCLKRGLCESHIKEVNESECAVQQVELPSKAFLFIRVNILYTLLFKKSTKCEKIKILLQRTPIFSRIVAGTDASEAADAILVLDSVVIYTLCQLSKICCIGALFERNSETSEDPEIKHLQKLLYVDRIEGTVLQYLYPLLQKKFKDCDLDLVKVSYVLTLLFVRNYCLKLNIKTAIETIEDDFKGGSCWENFKNMGDVSFQNENYNEASKAYTSAVMLNSYSSELFTQRAQTYLKLGKLKAAQLDAYIAVIIDSKNCEGYYLFSSSLFHQKLYEDAVDVANYGLSVCESNGSYYETLQTLCIEIKMKNLSIKESPDNLSANSDNHNDSREKPSPGKKYFPVLVDSDSADSESEASNKNIPELVEASDSDESETMEKKTICMQTKNKTKKKRIPSEDSSDLIIPRLNMTKIRMHLKEASDAIISDCGYKAVQIFRGPLRDFIDAPNLDTFEECEIVCIKYAYGIAYCKSGGYDDLLRCITILKEIIEKHDSVTFPTACYALGLTYRKLNRFKEALTYLETVKSFLSKGIHFKVYSWPEIPTAIQETKSDILKGLVEDLIKECENPPNPDALCRFAECSYQSPIYYTDPDFKGYTSLNCSEQCCLQYHLQCWKTMKTEKQLTDKEFLEHECFTPDCEGIIIKIQNIDKKGDLAKEFLSDFKKVPKQRWAKWEKKTDTKEKKKKKANVKSDDCTQEVPHEGGRASSRKNSESNDKSTIVNSSDCVNSFTEKDTAISSSSSSSESVQKSSQNVNAIELDINSKRSDISSSSVSSVQDIPHDSENENKSGCAQEIPDVSLTGNEFINTEFSEDVTSEYLVSQCIKNNIYSYMSDFLQHQGPLRIDDPILSDEISCFPEEIIIMIAECGGIGEFLKNDLRFAVVGDTYICIVADLATAYRMNSSSSLSTNMESLQSLQGTNHSEYYKECGVDSYRPSSGLNPEAVEYTPAVASVDSNDVDHKININNSLLKNLNSNNLEIEQEPSSVSSNNSATIDNNQKEKSGSCDSVSSKVFNNSESPFSISSHFNSLEICDNKNSVELSNEHICKSETPQVANSGLNVSDINSVQNYQERSSNVSDSTTDLSYCDMSKESLLESSEEHKEKIKIEFLPVLQEICGENFNNFYPYINACIKPYAIRKLPEVTTTGTETDLENAADVISVQHSRHFSDSVNVVKKHLAEQNQLLENQLKNASKENQNLLEEVCKLKKSLSSDSYNVEVLKNDYKKKEEASLSGRQYLLKSLTDAHSSIDEQKKRIELLEAMNIRLENVVTSLTSSLNENEKKMKNIRETEEKKHDAIENLQMENRDLKCRIKYAEIQFLQTKKTEYINRIEDKYREESRKRQEFTQGLSMFSGNLNPVVQSSMKAVFAQLSSYVKELNTLKLECVKKIDEQIEKVSKGASLQDLKDTDLKPIPDLPQNLLPFGKYPSNSTQTAFDLFNMGPLLQIPTAASSTTMPSANSSAFALKPSLASAISQGTPSATITSQAAPSATIIPQATPSIKIIPQATPSIKIIPQATPLATIIPQATPLATIIPQATPLATIISQATPSATIIPQATPSATIIPQATPSTTIMPQVNTRAGDSSSMSHSVQANNKKTFDISNAQDSFKKAGHSLDTLSFISYPVPTLDKEFNKTCAIFRPPEPVSNGKLDALKMPPGITICKTTSSSSLRSSTSKDSLDTFPSAERIIGGINAVPTVNEPGHSSSEQEKKKTVTGAKAGTSYDKLLSRLKENFPSYSQDKLISFVKEFRSQRPKKLTGMPMDSIISEFSTFLKKKNSATSLEQKAQPKVNKVLVNKKLVPDTKPPAVTEPQNVKKKSAWGTIDTDCKRSFTGNSDDDCTICCDPMTSTSAYKVACGHTFHEECIRLWLNTKSNCPVCRVLLLLPEEYPSLS